MPIQLTFIVVTAILAALVGLAALFAMLTARRDGAESSSALVPAAELRDRPEREQMVGIERGIAYESVLRILWWLTIAVVLVGVGVSDAYRDQQSLIFALGGAGVVVVVLLHELLPDRYRSSLMLGLEALVALALVTGLLLLTGNGNSPFFFAFDLVAVAVALGRGGRAAFLAASLATLAYLGVLAVDPASSSYGTGELLRFGLNIGSIWLLAYLAAVFAAQERRWRGLSQIDALTGLFNRGQIAGTLEQEVSRTRRSSRGFCLLMVDLDGLKAVNDGFGHHRGDEVLRAVGGVLRRSLRAVDTGYRYGGDEFLVLLPETDIPGAFVVAEKIRSGVEEIGLALAGGEVQTSVSIGLVSHPEDGATADELMKAADAAMYHAKSLGKNQISGVPRARRQAPRHLPVPIEPFEPPRNVVPPASVAELPPPEPLAEAPLTEPPAEPEAAEPAAVPTAAAPALAAPNHNGHLNGNNGDEEADPTEMRAQIAAARRSFDPDHQIRRAMDAFLSSGNDDPPSRRPD